MVRTFRPDVLIARFSGTERDGHGHHQASAILTKEAFRAAADPNRFPAQIREGLQPWQPKKLFIGNVCGFGASTCDPANYTVKLNTGKEDHLLGMSYVQFAVEGLRHQESQGLGDISIPKGDRFAYYKLLDSVVESPRDRDGHEQSFFDGIDTSLPGLASRLGDEEKNVPWLRPALAEIKAKVDEATVDGDASPTAAAEPLAACYRIVHEAIINIHNSPLSYQGINDVQPALEALQDEIEQAEALAAGVSLHVIVDAPIGSDSEHAFVAVPGQTFDVTATRLVASGKFTGNTMRLNLPDGWEYEILSTAGGGPAAKSSDSELVTRYKVSVPPSAQLTRPYWHRDDPETEALNTIDDPQYQGLPFPPPPLQAEANISRLDRLTADGMVRYKDSSGRIAERPLMVVPQFSVALEPGEQVIAVSDGKELIARVGVSSSAAGGPKGILRLKLPDGWTSEPHELTVNLPKRGDKQDLVFKLSPASLKEGRTEIRAVLEAGGKKYSEGYTLVTREDLGAAYYYQPAVQRVSIVDVKVPKDLKVGYIMGAGDDIPTVLEQLGMNVTVIPADKLASEDLSKYQTIVLGIRAYDTQKDVIDNNKRLLDFVENGGRLVVQYNTLGSFGVPIDFNSGKYTPYPATLSRARVSVEEAPVTILDPANPIFHSPNEINQKDFEGWVQERGLYFMSQWDANFTPLLESHDPGEGEQKGGLLVAHYGKGTYIYTGYAFFRQLPAGVPGAVRLFVNLISSR
ncbi:MAG: hypothetical protein ACLP0A_15550 [Verrucomicrobiia bacterium]